MKKDTIVINTPIIVKIHNSLVGTNPLYKQKPKDIRDIIVIDICKTIKFSTITKRLKNNNVLQPSVKLAIKTEPGIYSVCKG